MSFSLVQQVHVAGAAGANTATATLTTTTAGNLVISYVMCPELTPNTPTAAPGGSGTFHTAIRQDAGPVNGPDIFYIWNVGAATSVTATTSPIFCPCCGPVNGTVNLVVEEWSGVLSSSDPLDKTAEQGGATGTSITTPSATITTSPQLLVGTVAQKTTNTSPFTQGSGWGGLIQFKGNSANAWMAVEHQTAASIASYAATFTTSDGADAWNVLMATFKAAPPPAVTGRYYDNAQRLPRRGRR
jgi:hypothetical protein